MLVEHALKILFTMSKITTLFKLRSRSPKESRGGAEAILLGQQKAIYLPIPKVACSSIKKAIADWQEITVTTAAESNVPLIHEAPFEYVDARQGTKFKNYWKFCFVRNPWDRLVSCYKEKIKKDPSFFGKTGSFINGVHIGLVQYNCFRAGMPFEEFVDAVASIPDAEADGHFRSQVQFLSDQRGNVLADFVGRFENLSSDFAYVRRRLKANGLQLPHLNRTNQKTYRSYYTDSLCAKVLERYEDDISTFGYEF